MKNGTKKTLFKIYKSRERFTENYTLLDSKTSFLFSLFRQKTLIFLYQAINKTYEHSNKYEQKMKWRSSNDGVSLCINLTLREKQVPSHKRVL